MKDYKSNNLELSSFVVSVYLLGYAFGPLILGPLSEMYGRLPIYHSCNVLFVIFTVACAVATNLDSLIVFRFLAGIAGSSPLTIGAGTLSDMIAQEKRGAAMAAWAMGPLLGPVVGPIAGGYLTEAAGWRWTFWVLAIAVSLLLFCFVLFYYFFFPSPPLRSILLTYILRAVGWSGCPHDLAFRPGVLCSYSS